MIIVGGGGAVAGVMVVAAVAEVLYESGVTVHGGCHNYWCGGTN